MIKVKDMKKKVRMKNEKLEIKLADLSNIALLSMFQFKKMMEQETDLTKKSEYEQCGDSALVLLNYLNRISDSLDTDESENLMITCQMS